MELATLYVNARFGESRAVLFAFPASDFCRLSASSSASSRPSDSSSGSDFAFKILVGFEAPSMCIHFFQLFFLGE